MKSREYVDLLCSFTANLPPTVLVCDFLRLSNTCGGTTTFAMLLLVILMLLLWAANPTTARPFFFSSYGGGLPL